MAAKIKEYKESPFSDAGDLLSSFMDTKAGLLHSFVIQYLDNKAD